MKTLAVAFLQISFTLCLGINISHVLGFSNRKAVVRRSIVRPDECRVTRFDYCVREPSTRCPCSVCCDECYHVSHIKDIAVIINTLQLYDFAHKD